MLKTIIIFLLCGIVTLTAQEQATQEFHHQIGVAGSSMSGYGISYQAIFSDNYRVKLTGFCMSASASTTYDSDDFYLSAGIEGQKTLYKTEATRLYGLLGVGFYKQGSYDYPPNYGFSSYSHTENTYSGGAGFGVELIAAGRISFNFDVGLAYSFSERKYYTNDGTPSPITPIFRSEVGVGIAGGIGFGYRF